MTSHVQIGNVVKNDMIIFLHHLKILIVKDSLYFTNTPELCFYFTVFLPSNSFLYYFLHTVINCYVYFALYAVIILYML